MKWIDAKKDCFPRDNDKIILRAKNRAGVWRYAIGDWINDKFIFPDDMKCIELDRTSISVPAYRGVYKPVGVSWQWLLLSDFLGGEAKEEITRQVDAKKYVTKALTMKRFDVEVCEKNPDKLFVFGDNTCKKGTAGQACIRFCQNSIGIPTKRRPSMKEDAFMMDHACDIKSVLHAISALVNASREYEEVVFPEDGLGTGLAEMPTRSPIAYRLMNATIKELFGIDLTIELP